MVEIEGWIARPGGMQRGTVHVGDHIEAVDALGPIVDVPTDDAPRILPGFIDPHVHGGGGGDAMDGPDGVRSLANFHLRRGTTTLYPTTITNPWDAVLAALDGIAQVRDAQDDTRLPDLPGAHLEGPFISPNRLGAQPDEAVLPTPERVEAILAMNVVRVVTIAPEIDGATEAALRMAKAGIRISIGHTRASAETVQAFVEAVREAGGTIGFTHLFNAMGGLGGREPGIVGACLADPHAHAEMILDGHHVHFTSFLAAHAALQDRLLLVTDAIRATGMGDGPSELGGQAIEVHDGKATLPSGTLAGSVLTMDQALRNAVAAGLPLATAAHLTSGAAARYLGLTDRGRIEPGLRADLVTLDANLRVQSVLTAGRNVPGIG